MAIALVSGCELDEVKERKISYKTRQSSRLSLRDRLQSLNNPLEIGLSLHATIVQHPKFLSKPMIKQYELDLAHELDAYLQAYHSLTINSSTPFPFPMVNMTYILVDVWLYTLPFALCDDISNVIVACAVIFFLTFGFGGLTWVATEIQDPFNGDPNDFDMDKYRNRTAYGIIADLDNVFTTMEDWLRQNKDRDESFNFGGLFPETNNT